MTAPDRHQRIYELFVQARDLPSDRRAGFLDEACGDDALLRREIEGLLAQEKEISSFLETPPVLGETAARQAVEGLELSSSRPVPETLKIEGYDIIREVHRGGQGVVYEAVQRNTKSRVAIKVLREGPHASKLAQSRFEREIELAAQLKHPNIVSIFHSGTTPDGWRYCAMDYIPGLPLHHYVREHQLTVEEVLRIFGAVCDAVQYAHHKGVIHRDLKPSNIMVDSLGNPRILDFGLAKQLLSPIETVASLTHDVIGTLPYMSPEQAKGNPDYIDTRTDIYALGVILYELLTGHYPYPVVGQMVDVLRVIAETPPTPPTDQWTADSGVTRRTAKQVRSGHCPIDSDLQTVILKTLSKERERRYQSAGDLARDLAHYLACEPIEARRDSMWYVLGKALVRHRTAVMVAGAFIVVIGVFGTLIRSTRTSARVDELLDQGMKAKEAGYWDKAVELFLEAHAVDPNHLKALTRTSWGKLQVYCLKPYFDKDQTLLIQARELCDRALQLELEDHGIWNLKGSLELLLGNLSESERALRQALRLNASNHSASRNLAMVLALSHKLDEALEVARLGAAAEAADDTKGSDQPYDDEIWRVLGTLQFLRKDPAAIDSLRTAIDREKEAARTLLMLARVWLSQPNQQKAALEEAKAADRNDSLQDPRFKRILALAYLRNTGFEEDAAFNAEAALLGGDEPAYCHTIWAIAEARLGHLADARDHLQEARKNLPAELREREVMWTAYKDFLWFDTRAELESLQEDAERLISQ